MCNTHTDKRILSDTLKVMKDCYLNSSVPPKLHINIPQSMANAILAKDVGPYILRPSIINSAHAYCFVTQPAAVCKIPVHHYCTFVRSADCSRRTTSGFSLAPNYA